MKEQASKVRTIVVPDNLWEKLRMQSIREKRSASDIIRDLVAAYLKKKGVLADE